MHFIMVYTQNTFLILIVKKQNVRCKVQVGMFIFIYKEGQAEENDR